MKAKLVMLLMILILLLPISFSVYADQKTPAKELDELDTLSDEVLQLVRSERYEDAKKILDYFSNQFSSVSVNGSPFTVDERRILTGTHDEAVEAITNQSIKNDERINSVTKFRLAVDAVSSGEQPLWTQMEEPVMSTYREMKDAILLDDKEKFDEKLDSFLSLYQIIYPSLKLDVSAAQFQELNSLVEFMNTYRLQVFNQQGDLEEVTQLESELQDVFNQLYEDEADPSLWWVIISTGSIIILTLSYVGWRKYLGDKAEKRKTKQKRDNI
ncbi:MULTISPECIES: sporulation protein YpjB [Niallia]|jgi:sporulation protein YpjB|uniref:Sporulation protein YpjB n=1 Tax=Niallia circulans TaxID=1397 RepID=A0A268F9S4_NIACI|nr:sporulation protein YpjB [Niallia circulans]AYV66854.1 sporulation protein YpjB [Niallia circulans]AYV70291.1 sporulation protein YpjB [Niallia circulans]NRG29056.1 sporulation protein YpjB [Niallia circulans]NRG32835.1 sporulation protein YpjB [Niallia circulans]PAD82132.1 sporulation protein YpjB [Niallia circulans]